MVTDVNFDSVELEFLSNLSDINIFFLLLQKGIYTVPFFWLSGYTSASKQLFVHLSSLLWASEPTAALMLVLMQFEHLFASTARVCAAHLGTSSTTVPFNKLHQEHCRAQPNDKLVLLNNFFCHSIAGEWPFPGKGVGRKVNTCSHSFVMSFRKCIFKHDWGIW